MKFFRLVIILLFLNTLLFAYPVLQMRVNDYANFLTPEQQNKLEAFLASYEKQTGHQMVLLTIPSLANEPIESFGIRIAEEWKIGNKDKDDGIILIIAKAERQIRIEVGYGLEGVITDAFAGQVIREVIVPAFREERYYDGIYAAFYAIATKIGDKFEAEKPQVYYGQPMDALEALFIIIFILLFLWFSRASRRSKWIFLGGFGGFGGPFGGGFSGGGGSFGGGGASGRW